MPTFLRHTVHALTTVAVVAVPLLVALDRGGVWAWDLWLLAVCAVLFLAATFVGNSHAEDSEVEPLPRRQQRLVQSLRWAPMLLIAAASLLALFQLTPFPSWFVNLISPNSYDAYSQWLPDATGQSAPNWFCISVAPYLTQQTLLKCLVLLGFAYVAGTLFSNREFAIVLLVGLTIGGIGHGVLGMVQQATEPNVYLFGEERIGKPFGTFVNRNNAGALLNFALAGAVGLLACRIYSTTEILRPSKRKRKHSTRSSRSDSSSNSLNQDPIAAETPDQDGSNPALSNSGGERTSSGRHRRSQRSATSKPMIAPLPRGYVNPSKSRSWRLGELQSVAWMLIGDRLFLLALAAAGVLLAAVLSSGSRGALVGAVAGTIACFIIAIPAQRLARISFGALALVLVVMVALNTLGIEAESIERLTDGQSQGSIERDGRFAIWRDAFNASWGHCLLGGGLGAYRYIHLPFQQQMDVGSSGWALNADGQWVEWWLEGGLAMLALLVVGLVVIVWSLSQLLRQKNTIDRGLGTAGVFALASIGLSQSFDFGLTLSPNAILTILFATAITARASVLKSVSLSAANALHRPVDWSTIEGERPLSPARRRVPTIARVESIGSSYLQSASWKRVAFCSLLMSLAIVVVWRTSRAAESQAMRAFSAMHRNGQVVSLDELKRVSEMLDNQIERDSWNDALLLERAAVEQECFRLLYAAEQSVLKSQPLQKSYDESTFRNIRISSSYAPRPAIEHLQAAYANTLQALELNPYSDVARWNLIHFDFAITDRTRTSIVLQQLAQLRRRNAEPLMQVADAAVINGDWEIAKEIWKRVLAMDSRWLPQVYKNIGDSNGIVLIDEVLPTSREVVLGALELELRNNPTAPNANVLEQATKILRLPITDRERQLKAKLE